MEMYWITRTIVCGCATGFVMCILLSLSGCAAMKSDHGGSVYGGFGNAWHKHDSWQYGSEDNQIYGIVGIEYEARIHQRDPVYIRGAIEHNSDPNGRDKPGGNSGRLTGHIKF